jgi:hypothetical protein
LLLVILNDYKSNRPQATSCACRKQWVSFTEKTKAVSRKGAKAQSRNAKLLNATGS